MHWRKNERSCYLSDFVVSVRLSISLFLEKHPAIGTIPPFLNTLGGRRDRARADHERRAPGRGHRADRGQTGEGAASGGVAGGGPATVCTGDSIVEAVHQHKACVAFLLRGVLRYFQRTASNEEQELADERTAEDMVQWQSVLVGV